MFIYQKLISNIYFILLFIVLIIVHCISLKNIETPLKCLSNLDGEFAYYFDSTSLSCNKCFQNRIFQQTRLDGQHCECKQGHSIVMGRGKNITCKKCSSRQMVWHDGKLCVGCGSFSTFNTTTKQCSCNSPNSKQVLVFKGVEDTTASADLQCTVCPASTRPSADFQECHHCAQEDNSLDSCECKYGRANDGYCYLSEENFEPQLYTIDYMNSEIRSQYLQENARKSIDRCGNLWHDDVRACQALTNMCISLLLNPNHALCNKLLQRQSSLESLYYNSHVDGLPFKATTTSQNNGFDDEQVTQVYTFPDSKLDVILQTTDIHGNYNGSFDAVHYRHWLQLCKSSSTYLQAAFVFGTNFKQKCAVQVNELYDQTLHPPFYFQAFLRYRHNGDTMHAQMPVYIANSNNAQPVNRFFIVENIIGNQGNDVYAIMYASSLEIVVRLRTAGGGLIYTPHVNIRYKALSMRNRNTTTSAIFQVKYEMDQSENEKTIWIWFGVLVTISVVFTGMDTWSDVQRGGHESLFCLHFVFILANHISNAISLVLFASSLWTFIFYKYQKVVSTLPHNGLESAQFIGLLVTAFAFKLVSLVRLVFSQVNADVFLVDWESPNKSETISPVSLLSNQMSNRQLPPLERSFSNKPFSNNFSSNNLPANNLFFNNFLSQNLSTSSNSSFPSVWRMYLVANEWNEIQSYRKLSPLIQLLFSIIILDVIGVGNLCSMDPLKYITGTDFPSYTPPNNHSSTHSHLLRFTWIAVVYLCVALFQALLSIPIYERFFDDKIGQLVDLCSTCNVSLMILTTSLHGHYIHGRSVHAKSDVGLREMHENFSREEKDLVGKRGLLPGEDQQTFEVSISHKLRENIDKIVRPIFSDTRRHQQDPSHQLDKRLEHSIQSHYILNQLLKAFIDHGLEDEDYAVNRKSLPESLLNFEGKKVSANTLYYDNGHSFDQSLLYGHEAFLLLFEVLLCACLDLVCGSFTLSFVLTFVFVLLVKKTRESFGKRNLAIKTMVDQRFLI